MYICLHVCGHRCLGICVVTELSNAARLASQLAPGILCAASAYSNYRWAGLPSPPSIYVSVEGLNSSYLHGKSIASSAHLSPSTP